MNSSDLNRALRAATQAAHAAGAVMRKNLRLSKRVNDAQQHDIKLELDVRCQKLIERTLRSAFRDIPVLGEEGVRGDTGAAERWVVDPIDGTVNFTYGIPHACVSIALQARAEKPARSGDSGHQTLLGVVYDPFLDEMFTATATGPARLNGRPIAVSTRAKLAEAIVTVGFAKSKASLDAMLPEFNRLVHRVRKIRIMGAAALALTYVASGRFDAYVEAGVRLWDIAAGGLILERAGGDFWRRPIDDDHGYEVIANNGHFRRKLRTRPRV